MCLFFFFQLTYLKECHSDDITPVLDSSAGVWDTGLAQKIYEIGATCTRLERAQRPTMEPVYEKLQNLNDICNGPVSWVKTAQISIRPEHLASCREDTIPKAELRTCNALFCEVSLYGQEWSQVKKILRHALFMQKIFNAHSSSSFGRNRQAAFHPILYYMTCQA